CQRSYFGGILYRYSQAGHAGIHKNDIFPAAQKTDDGLGLAAAGTGRGGRAACSFLVCVFISIVSKTTRCGEAEFSDHKVGHEVSDDEKYNHTDDKVDNVSSETCPDGHGN